MADFNLEDKITFEELATSLQNLLNGKASTGDYTNLQILANKINSQLNGVRVTITTNQNSISSPQNDKELSFNKNEDLLYTRSNNKWVPGGAVYS